MRVRVLPWLHATATREAMSMRNDSLSRKRILPAADFSKAGRRAHAYALRLSPVPDARLTLLHFVKAPPGFEAAGRRSLAPLNAHPAPT